MNPPGPHPHPGASGAPEHRSTPADAEPAVTARGAAVSATARRRAAALAGHTADLTTAGALLADPDPGVRATALGALLRAGGPLTDVLPLATDPEPAVRRRLAEELGRRAAVDRAGDPEVDPSGPDPDHDPDVDDLVVDVLAGLLTDDDALTCEAAAWALGEVADGTVGATARHRETAVGALVGAAGHEDALVRESAVAALGAIGDPAGLATVLEATTDRPAVRRRAVIALAAFLGEPGVDEALERATKDRDWQVRQAAEMLRRPDP